MSLYPEDIKILNVDGTPYVVADLPENVQRMVDIYNVWRREEIEAKLKVMQIEGSQRNLSMEIINAVRASTQEGNDQNEAPAPTEGQNEAPAPTEGQNEAPAPVAEAPAAGEMPTSELDGVVTEGQEV